MHISKHSLFRLKITVGCPCTYPSVHVATLKITVGSKHSCVCDVCVMCVCVCCGGDVCVQCGVCALCVVESGVLCVSVGVCVCWYVLVCAVWCVLCVARLGSAGSRGSLTPGPSRTRGHSTPEAITPSI